METLKQPVVVTGAFGFIGQRVVEALLESGVEKIVAFDLPGLTLPDHWNGKVTYCPGDISYQHDVDRAMAGAGTVIHLAAMVGDWIPLRLHEKVTVDGSRWLFEAALKNSTRVVLASSIVVYGDQLTNGFCSEDKEWGNPLGPYSTCKQEQEKLAWHYYQEHGMPLSVVRVANVYGPGSKPWVHDLVDTIKTGAPVLVNGGDFNAALVYVDNVVQLLLLCATKDEALGEVFNGGDGNRATWKIYVGDLAETLNLPTPKSIPGAIVRPLLKPVEKFWTIAGIKKRPPLTREAFNLVAEETDISIGKAKNMLGYQPRVDYAQGVARVKDYINQQLN